MAEPEVLTLREVEKMLRVSRDTLMRMINEGRIQAFKVRGNWRIRREEVERIMRGEK